MQRPPKAACGRKAAPRRKPDAYALIQARTDWPRRCGLRIIGADSLLCGRITAGPLSLLVASQGLGFHHAVNGSRCNLPVRTDD